MTITVKELKEIVALLPEELNDTPIYQYNSTDDCSDTIGGIKILKNLEDRKNCYLAHTGDPAWEMVKTEDGKWVEPFPLILIY